MIDSVTRLDPEDYFGLMAHGLSQPLADEAVTEPDIRVPKPLRTGEDYWEGHRNPSGRTYMASKKATNDRRSWQKPRRKA